MVNSKQEDEIIGLLDSIDSGALSELESKKASRLIIDYILQKDYFIIGTKVPKKIKVFEKINDESQIEYLRDVYSSMGFDYKKRVLYLLACLGDKKIIDLILGDYTKADDMYHQNACRSLEKLNVKDDPRVTAFLIKMLKKQRHVKHSAINALGRVGNPTAIEPLMKFTTHSNEFLRANAIISLLQLKEKRVVDNALTILMKTWEVDVAPIIKALNEIPDTDAYTLLMKKYEESKTDDDIYTDEVIKALGRLGDRRALPLLIEKLYDFDLAREAVNALGILGDKSAIEPILAFIERGESAYYIGGGIQALGNLNAVETIPLIKKLVKKYPDEEGIQNAAGNALYRLGYFK